MADETRKKISNSCLGRTSVNKRKIYIIIDNNTITFDSITEASIRLNIKRTNISNNLNNYSKYVNSVQYGKIKFKYYDSIRY